MAKSWDLSAYTPEILAIGCDHCGRGLGRRCRDQTGRDVAPHAARKAKAEISARDLLAETRGKISAYEDIRAILTESYRTAEPYSDLRALASAITGVEDRLRLLRDGRGGESFGEVFGDRPGEPTA